MIRRRISREGPRTDHVQSIARNVRDRENLDASTDRVGRETSTGDPTQMAQEEIVKKLDQMIETLNQK